MLQVIYLRFAWNCMFKLFAMACNRSFNLLNVLLAILCKVCNTLQTAGCKELAMFHNFYVYNTLFVLNIVSNKPCKLKMFQENPRCLQNLWISRIHMYSWIFWLKLAEGERELEIYFHKLIFSPITVKWSFNILTAVTPLHTPLQLPMTITPLHKTDTHFQYLPYTSLVTVTLSDNCHTSPSLCTPPPWPSQFFIKWHMCLYLSHLTEDCYTSWQLSHHHKPPYISPMTIIPLHYKYLFTPGDCHTFWQLSRIPKQLNISPMTITLPTNWYTS